MIDFLNVWKSFGGQPVLRGLSLSVRRGEILFVIGASGGQVGDHQARRRSIAPDRGEVWFDGQRVDQLSEAEFYAVRRRCAMVFQH